MRGWFAGLAFLIPGLVAADPCNLVAGSETIWDFDGRVAKVKTMTVLIVTRHQSKQPLDGSPVDSRLWTDDIPSDTIGADAICDRVQLETPIPLNTWDRLDLTMQQGERLRPGFDVAQASPELAKRLAEAKRTVTIQSGPYFVTHIPDLSDPDWRVGLLAKATRSGDIDTNRWMVGLPGALYLVPLEVP